LAARVTHAALRAPITIDRKTFMIKKPVRKIQLARETIRVVSAEMLPAVVGGITQNATCTLHESTGPFPSHGSCGGTIIFV
jgi:hypothetical protein